MGRVMLSLTIADEEMYSEFIKPWNDEKALKPLIYDLLKAYYSNEQFRADADNLRYGVDDSGMSNDVDTLNADFGDLLANARQSLAMMTAVTEQFEGSIETSLEEILGIVDDTIDNIKSPVDSGSSTDVDLPMLETSLENSNVEIPSTSSVNKSDFEDAKKSSNAEDSIFSESNITSLVTKVVDERMSHVETELKETRGSIDDIMMMLRQLTSTGVRPETPSEVEVVSGGSAEASIEEDGITEVDADKVLLDSVSVIETAEPVVTVSNDSSISDEVDLFDESDEDIEPLENADTSEDDIAEDYEDDEEEGFGALTAFLDNGVSFSETI